MIRFQRTMRVRGRKACDEMGERNRQLPGHCPWETPGPALSFTYTAMYRPSTGSPIST